MKNLLFVSVLICILSLSLHAGIIVGGGFAGCTHGIAECHACDLATMPDPACDLSGGITAISESEPPEFGGALVDAFVNTYWVFESVIH